MFQKIEQKVNFGGVELIIQTGQIARQADAAVITKMGNTIVLSTVCVANQPNVNYSGSCPLAVHYREMFFAAGKIPGGFIKREGKASEHEVLVSRLIDRSIRPLFPENFHHETQVISTVLSYDSLYSPDILAIIGVAAALSLSKIPIITDIAAARVGMIGGNFVLNPSFDKTKSSKLDLILSGSDTSIVMIESEVSELSEAKILEAMQWGHSAIQDVVTCIKKLKQAHGKEKLTLLALDDALELQILSAERKSIQDTFAIRDKQDRYAAFSALRSELISKYTTEIIDAKQVVLAIEAAESTILRDMTLNSSIRIDGRRLNEIRPIECETRFLPSTHGSALFTRGETQAIVATTLGTGSDEQISEGMEKTSKEHFILHYTFPPYAVGETSQLKPPGRREIGHGKLALRAFKNVLPIKAAFPYTIRVVSEITESNGSSSMATVCGASLSMMDAGVPLQSHVAGIAMGLIKGKDNNFAILSDILGDEDHLGDMDFKVAGTKNGITALQMDIKVDGIGFDILQTALQQAHEGRMHILKIMNDVITTPDSINQNAPRIIDIKIPKEKIKDLIGPGGKVIREICESTDTKIKVLDDGVVQIASNNQKCLDAAVVKIKMVTSSNMMANGHSNLSLGAIVDGTVAKVLNNVGAFVAIAASKEDGFLPISEILSIGRVGDINDHLQVGQIIQVKIIAFEQNNKPKVSIKALKI